MQIGVMYDGFSPFPAALDFVRRADGLGLDSVWIAEHTPFRDALGPAMAFLGETKNLVVVPTAISPYTRNPVLIAMALATLAERGPGRVRAVLGTGQPDDLEAVGAKPTRPLQTMKESLQIVRSALGGEVLNHRGEVFRATDRRLDFPPSLPVPLYLAAMGPKMLQLAGSHADGVLFSGGCSPAYIRWGAELVAQGAAEVREAPEKGVLASVIVASMSSDRKKAYRAVQRTLAFILRGPHHDRNLNLAGTNLDREALARSISQADWGRAEGMMDDAVIRNHSVAGDEVEFKERLSEFSEAGLDVGILLLQGTKEDRIRALEAAARM